ncbi:MAG: exported protein, TonB-dependent receptor [Elusimicrobia bacterium]|nr:MAG: exported protein, TonB-dependent receptor [Elusimicrobiota bacterium]
MNGELAKRLLGLGTIGAMAAALSTGLAAAPAPKPVAGVIIDVKGSPTLKAAADGKTLKLKLQQFIYEGDVIKTGTAERAAMAFVGGAEMRINESSEFQVESGGGAKPTSVYTKAGQAWTRLLHGKSGMNLRSPLAVAAVRGTEADVDVDDRMSVKVYEGLVDVQNEYGSQSLRAGMMTEVAGAGQAPGAPRAMDPNEYGAWQNQLDPKDIAGQLKRLASEADKSRSINLKFKGKDGTEKSLDIKLKKK